MFKIFQEAKPIKWVYSHQTAIDFSPAYQRHGNLWTKQQKQLLIDSILNGLDIPKFYFQFMPPCIDDFHYNYAIIDGKQRLTAVLEFIHDEFPLSSKFKFLDNNLISQFGDISGKFFSQIESSSPALIAQFWQYELNIVFMDTTEPDIINELFVRLNSGVSVSTSEKRHANGGALSNNIQKLCNTSSFFAQKIKVDNRRFARNDLALKLLMLEMGEFDLTKKSIDRFIDDNKDFTSCRVAFERLQQKTNAIANFFEDKDPILSKKNIIITLYTVLEEIPVEKLRPFMQYFENYRASVNSDDIVLKKDADLNLFTRLLQQGADKKNSIQERKNIMKHYIHEFLKYN